VFQDINQAAAYCDHLVFMSRGKVAAHGDTRDVLNPDTVRAVFGVEARVTHDDYSNSLHVVYKR
jgi:iron complex transport system ATP-binding protein